MAVPSGHDRSPKVSTEEEEEEEDPIETMVKKTGCAQYHYAVQDCMFEKQDWRKCQKEVEAFKACIVKSSMPQNKGDSSGKSS